VRSVRSRGIHGIRADKLGCDGKGRLLAGLVALVLCGGIAAAPSGLWVRLAPRIPWRSPGRVRSARGDGSERRGHRQGQTWNVGKSGPGRKPDHVCPVACLRRMRGLRMMRGRVHDRSCAPLRPAGPPGSGGCPRQRRKGMDRSGFRPSAGHFPLSASSMEGVHTQVSRLVGATRRGCPLRSEAGVGGLDA
jgi:hypothetical protein